MSPDIYSTLKYFSKKAFEYPYEMDIQLLEKLDIARRLAGVPFVITSDFRTPAHNEAVGGSPDSAHLKGLAVDIAVPSAAARFLMIDGIRTAGFRRIGIGANFIHVDIDPDKPQEVMWTYK